MFWVLGQSWDMLGDGAGCRMLVLGWCPDSVSGEMLLCITDGAAEGWHRPAHSAVTSPGPRERLGGSGRKCSRLFPTHHVEPWEIS